jgi:hypothetical protein
MERWGYALPPEWGITGLRRSDRIGYAVFSFVARLYWRYLRQVGAGGR